MSTDNPNGAINELSLYKQIESFVEIGEFKTIEESGMIEVRITLTHPKENNEPIQFIGSVKILTSMAVGVSELKSSAINQAKKQVIRYCLKKGYITTDSSKCDSAKEVIKISNLSTEKLSSVGAGISSNDYAVMDKCRFLLDVINSDPAKCDFDSVKDKAISKLSELIEGL